MPREPADLRLAAAIREIRIDLERTQEEVADRAEIAASQLSKVERGIDNPTWTTVARIAGALDLRPWELARAAEEDG